MLNKKDTQNILMGTSKKADKKSSKSKNVSLPSTEKAKAHKKTVPQDSSESEGNGGAEQIHAGSLDDKEDGSQASSDEDEDADVDDEEAQSTCKCPPLFSSTFVYSASSARQQARRPPNAPNRHALSHDYVCTLVIIVNDRTICMGAVSNSGSDSGDRVGHTIYIGATDGDQRK